MDINAAFGTLPTELRSSLIAEYRSILQNYLEGRWNPTELSGGKFCEIVFSILDGYSRKSYPSKATKPRNFVEACRKLENISTVPRSFQILIPRLLPALYEIRNNRGVGHVGGDVDSNAMDSAAVVAMAKWTIAELVRVLHDLTIAEAQTIADALAERTIPLVWESGDIRRVLDPTLSLRQQILILLATVAGKVTVKQIVEWTEVKNKDHFRKTLKALHKERLLNVSAEGKEAQILPPGTRFVEDLLTAAV